MSMEINAAVAAVGGATVAAADKSLADISNVLENYVKKMGNSVPADNATIAAAQRSLWNGLLAVMRLDGPSFTRAWAYILNFVHTDKTGSFQMNRVFRGMDVVQISADVIPLFQRLLYIIIATADPKTRLLRIEQIDMSLLSAKTGSTVPATGLDMIRAFYSEY